MSIRSLVVGSVLGAAVATAVGIAYASIPDANGVIHACYQNVTGANKPVKLLNTSQKTTCPSGWSAVAWNQQGVQGAPGQNGTNGVSGYTAASTTITFDTQHGNPSGTASCPSGKVPIGGGFDAGTVDIPQNWGVSQSAPVFTRDANGNIIGGGWKVVLSGVANPTSGGTFTVSALCATASN